MRRTTCVAVAAALVMSSSPAIAKAPVPLAPLKPWNLHYAENSCQLFRTFGDPARPTTMLLERIAPGSSMSLMVFGGALRARMASGKGVATFLPLTDRFDDGDIAETVDAKDTAILWSRVSLLPARDREAASRGSPEERRDPTEEATRAALEAEIAGKVTGLEIREPGGRRTVLQTGSLARANAMIRECAREQLVSWGLDPAVQDRIVRMPRNERNLARYFSPADYPREAMVRGQQSVIEARLIIDADGKVSRCTSLTRFSAEGFAEVVCRNLQRVVFAPAELADGSKVPSFVMTRVRFQMP